MTTLVFPESAEDWSAAFNNGLAKGEFGNDPASQNFWGRFDLQASEVEDEEIVADWFHQKNLLKYVRISRTEEDAKL